MYQSGSTNESKEEPAAVTGGGIRLGSKRKGNNNTTSALHPSSNSSITNNTNNNPNNSSSEADMERLRTSVQSLVQHIGPLGGCMDFILEDVETMAAEMRKWEEEARKSVVCAFVFMYLKNVKLHFCYVA
jgi:hypothetical protein